MRDSLYVAPSTMRTRVKSIYRKLGISTRREAVEEAHLAWPSARISPRGNTPVGEDGPFCHALSSANIG
jgi:hypothetical protein